MSTTPLNASPSRRPSPQAAWLRRSGGKLVVVLVSVMLSLLAIEVMMRLTDSYVPRAPLYPGEREAVVDAGFDPRIGWKLPANAEIPESRDGEYSVVYRSNAQGFRSPHDFSAPRIRTRVALAGDSYTFGSGVAYEDTFAALLEATLPETEVFNYGIGGFGIDQMWLTMRHYALPQGADVVVVVFVRQDFDRSLSAYRLGHAWLAKPTFCLADDELRLLTGADRPASLLRAVQLESHVYELIRRLDISVTQRRPWTYRWRLNRAIFRAMRDDAGAAGVPLAAVYLPNNNLQPMPYLSAEFADLGIPFLDLTPLLPVDAGHLYYPRDRHLTAAGHEFAAAEIARFLRESGFGASSTSRADWQ